MISRSWTAESDRNTECVVPPLIVDPLVARRLFVRGVVQGVGFRPFVVRMAVELRIAGWVMNDASGVLIHAEGLAADVAAFLTQIQSHPPATAEIDSVDVCETSLLKLSHFQIVSSRRDTAPTARISADLAICEHCLRELHDPTNRRYRYPYISCSDCGPRYSIIEQLPYDRPHTTMSAWVPCEVCQQEYDDPFNRRYHTQAIACSHCGPGYRLIETDRQIAASEPAIHRAAELLSQGKIVALKGLGGYHLACDARNAAAVLTLRDRKFRKERPFALLVRDLAEAQEFVLLTPPHAQLLQGIAHPIVLATARRELPGVSPDNHSLGVMLPYTPLHHLLFELGSPTPLVLTSGNRSSEPIAYRDDEALDRLSGLADAILVGERPIARRVDDSVVTVRNDHPFMIRRARGYAPGVVCKVPTQSPLLAVGSDLKNSVALAIQGQVIVTQHQGDLNECETQESFESTIRDLLLMYEIRAEDLVVAHDLHPEFFSTRFARRLPARQHIGVQHHHAHLASVLAEQNLLCERVVGVTFDGTGYGADGSIWGGEFFVGSVAHGFERQHSLRPVRLPGGDAAARLPVQSAAGFLAEFESLPDFTQPPWSFPGRFHHAVELTKKNVRCFVSTSMGRLFDAVAALAGFTRESTFEGQAASWLEYQARLCAAQAPYPFPQLDFEPLLKSVIADRQGGRPVPEIAAAFHAALALATVEKIRELCQIHQLQTVVLSGGVFQNELLLNTILDALANETNLRTLINQQIPTNDGGICTGQIALASARERS